MVALFDDTYYLVGQDGLVVSVDYTVWGWVHLLLGVLLLASGAGVMTGNLAARTVGVILAGLSALTADVSAEGDAGKVDHEQRQAKTQQMFRRKSG